MVLPLRTPSGGRCGQDHSRTLRLGISRNAEKVRADIRKMFAQGCHLHSLLRAIDAYPDTALWKVEADAQTYDEDDGDRPDEGRPGILGHQQHCRLIGTVQ